MCFDLLLIVTVISGLDLLLLLLFQVLICYCYCYFRSWFVIVTVMSGLDVLLLLLFQVLICYCYCYLRSWFVIVTVLSDLKWRTSETRCPCQPWSRRLGTRPWRGENARRYSKKLSCGEKLCQNSSDFGPISIYFSFAEPIWDFALTSRVFESAIRLFCHLRDIGTTLRKYTFEICDSESVQHAV